MIFSIIIILIIGGIAYFHYAQGFFSATMSAFCAVVAAVVAVSYHEVVVSSLLQGAAADYAHGMVLAALFAIVYIILRVLVDKMVPGALRLPVIVDRIGGAAMGLIAAVFTAGVVALCAQMLPFGPSIAGYSRYAVEDRPEVTIPANSHSRGQQRSADIHSQLTEDRLSSEKKAKLLIPVDDLLLSFVQGQSDGGALAADTPLASVHPDYVDELFAQRLGIQIGAKHVALNMPGKTPQVTLPEKGVVFRIDQDLSKGAVDAELPSLHQRPVPYVRNPAHTQLVVRIMFGKDAADTDGLVRLSLGSVRLVADHENHFPIGTVEGGKTLYLSKIDDPLFVDVKQADAGVDFFFDIEDGSKLLSGTVKDAAQKVKDGVFVEVKRMARFDLGGQDVVVGLTPGKNIKVERKEGLGPKKKEGATAEQPAAAAATEFTFTSATVATKLFSPINVASADKNLKAQDVAQGSGKVSTVNGQLSQLDIQPVATITLLAQGSYATDELYVPGNMKLVQVQGAPPAEGGDPWAWAQISKWQLIDAGGKIYTPAGAWAKVSKDNADRMAAIYNAVDPPRDFTNADGRPLDAWVAFLVPSGTQVKTLKFNNKVVKDDVGVTAQ